MLKFEILFAEVSQDKVLKGLHQRHQDNLLYSHKWIIAIILFILMLLAIHYYYARHRFDTLISDLKNENNNQLEDFKELQHNFEKLKINDENLKDNIDSHMTILGEIMDACYHAPKNVLAKRIQNLIKFQKSNKNIWSKLYNIIDNENNNLMTRTKEKYPQLNDRDLMMIALTCLGYSCSQIAIIMDYSTATSISTVRTRIANKMNLQQSLIEYIDQFKA